MLFYNSSVFTYLTVTSRKREINCHCWEEVREYVTLMKSHLSVQTPCSLTRKLRTEYHWWRAEDFCWRIWRRTAL